MRSKLSIACAVAMLFLSVFVRVGAQHVLVAVGDTLYSFALNQ